MSTKKVVDYGPLADLIGEWKGEDGVDVAPGPDAPEISPYYDTITYTPVGGVTNAKTQKLVAIHYQQVVQRKTNGNVFHHETGYWMWEPATETILHSLVIPRAVCVLAGENTPVRKTRRAALLSKLQLRTMTISGRSLNRHSCATTRRQNPSARELPWETAGCHFRKRRWSIYGEVFEHTDENQLVLT